MSTFYPEIKNREQVGYKENTKEETEQQAQERQQRHTSRTVLDTLDIPLHLPSMSVPPEKRLAMSKEVEEEAHSAERRSLEEKIAAEPFKFQISNLQPGAQQRTAKFLFRLDEGFTDSHSDYLIFFLSMDLAWTKSSESVQGR